MKINDGVSEAFMQAAEHVTIFILRSVSMLGMQCGRTLRVYVAAEHVTIFFVTVFLVTFLLVTSMVLPVFLLPIFR
jgi:hypothetical protein